MNPSTPTKLGDIELSKSLEDRLRFSDDWKDFLNKESNHQFLINSINRINSKRKKKGIQELQFKDFYRYADDYFRTIQDMIDWLNSGDYMNISRTESNSVENRQRILKIINGVRKDLGIDSLSFHNVTKHIAKYYDEECNFIFVDRARVKKTEEQFSIKKEKVRQKTTERSGFVYIVSSPVYEGFYKIGSTIDLVSRLSSYNTCSPFGDFDYLYYKFFYDRTNAEYKIHDIFDLYRVNGEWFNVEIEKIISFIDSMNE